MPQFRTKYEYTRPFGHGRHDWFVIGARGAIHLHISEPSDAKYDCVAGLEFHYRSPPDYMEDQAPSHDVCWVLKCPCWHDGTSLYARETLWPLIEGWLRTGDHEVIFRCLEAEADRIFGDAEEPENEAAA